MSTPTDETTISFLAEEIVNAHRDKMGPFVGAIIEGGLGKGKTAYAIKVMRDVFRTLYPELSMKEAYLMAIDHLFFKIDPFLRLTANQQRRMKDMLPHIDWTQRIPVITLDDASIYAGATLYFQDIDIYSAFQGTMTTNRTAYSGTLVTAPAHEALTKCLREYYDYYVVKITLTSSDDSLATIQEWYKRPRTKKLALRTVYEDVFTRHIPNKIYAKYLAPRIDLGIESVERMIRRSEERLRPPQEKVKAPVVVDPALKEAVEQVVDARLARKKRRTWTSLPAPPAPAQDQTNT